MGFHALDYSVSVIAYEKEERKYGMSCAWAMQVDYDKLLCLLGAQSQTGQHLQKGDRIGISVLDKHQKDIAMHFGDSHSLETDKFKNIKYKQEGSVILIPQATRGLVCEVIDILHLDKIDEDQLIYVQIVSSEAMGDDFLHYGDL